MSIMVGEGRNNFIIEWNENREAEVPASEITGQTPPPDSPDLPADE
jgi:hypothetical protein